MYESYFIFQSSLIGLYFKEVSHSGYFPSRIKIPLKQLLSRPILILENCHTLEKNLNKISKTVRNEEATVRM